MAGCSCWSMYDHQLLVLLACFGAARWSSVAHALHSLHWYQPTHCGSGVKKHAGMGPAGGVSGIGIAPIGAAPVSGCQGMEPPQLGDGPVGLLVLL